MRRPRRWPPQIYLHRPSGQDRMRVYYQDGTSRLVYLGPTGSPQSRQEYARLLAEITKHGGELPVRTKPGAAVFQLLDAFCAWAETYYDKRQYGRFKRALKPVAELYGHRPLLEFGPAALEVVQDVLVRDGLARTYVNSLVGCVRAVWAWGHRKQMVTYEQYDALRLVPDLARGKTEAREPEPILDVHPDDVAKVLPFVLPPVAAMIRLQQATGMRPGEVIVMRPGDIDTEGIVVGQTRVWLYRPERHKGENQGALRVIALGPAEQELLTPWLGRKPESYCFSPREAFEAWLVAAGRKVSHAGTRRPGERYQVSSYDHAIRKACKKAKVKPWHPHQLRHQCATAVQAERDLEEARVVLGHAAVQMTKRYAHADLVKLAQAAARRR